jgi:hypothetical protein
MRRFTRLTNAFSKKFENHCHALALYFFWYNFCRVHKTLGVTPAMASGLVDHVQTETLPDISPQYPWPKTKETGRLARPVPNCPRNGRLLQ